MADTLTDEYVRKMSDREHMTWHSALKVARTMSADDADDEMARRANNLDEHHDRLLYGEGRPAEARSVRRCSAIFDHARRTLI
jgi:hypothetical protein